MAGHVSVLSFPCCGCCSFRELLYANYRVGAPLGKIVIMQPAVLTGRFVDDLGLLEKPSLNVYRLAKALLVPVFIAWIAVYLMAHATR